MAFAVFFLAEYANMILISALAVLMFLGGWLSPFDGLLPDKVMALPVLGAVLGSGLHWAAAKISFMLFSSLVPRHLPALPL